MNKSQLKDYSNSNYFPGGFFKLRLWYLINLFFFKTSLPFPSTIKVWLLTIFGAKIGTGVVIKPSVNIKYPWFLNIGDYCWIGENVWIDNLAKVNIGSNVCLSQGAYLLTGNHNYKTPNFDLILGEITLEDGVWIGAKSIVCPGVICKSHSILAVNSVANNDLHSWSIYQGNPAVFKRRRSFKVESINHNSSSQ